MDNIYQNMLKLYKKHKESGRTPMEDFTTEILASLLIGNEHFLEEFCTNILGLNKEKFNVKTQVKYKLENDINCIIDMVFENTQTICFVENKVESGEGERQLERYAKLLHEINKQTGKDVYLRYCTKYLEFKNIDFHNFKQYRWKDVYILSEKYNTEMINTFRDFLRGHNMLSYGNLTKKDIEIFRERELFQLKINEIRSDIENLMKKRKWNPERSETEIGYWSTCKKINNIEYISEIYMCLYLNKDNSISEPHVAIGIVLKKEYKEIEKNLSSLGFDQLIEDGDMFDGWFERRLSDFIEVNNQNEKLLDWAQEKISIIENYFI